MGRLLALYTLLRLALVAVIAGILVAARVPTLVAVLIALVLAFGLSPVFFRGLRGRLDAELHEARTKRRAERERLRRALRGDDS